MRVDLHQDGAYSRNAGAPEAKDVIHYAVTGNVQELSTTTSGYPKAQLPNKKKK